MHSHRHAAKSAATDKLRRMTSTKGALKGDATGMPAEPADYNMDGRIGDDADMQTDKPTGMQPKPRAYKRGGRVEGEGAKKRLDRPSRKKRADGGTVSKNEDDYHYADTSRDADDRRAAAQAANEHHYSYEDGRKSGGRVKRASGGRVAGKGKTTVNIIVGSGDKQPTPVPVPVPAPGAGAPPPMPPRPPMQMPAGMPPGAPMGGAPMMPPGMPMRKRGGRVEGLSATDGGAGGGEGRLKKIALQKRAGK